MWGMCKSLSSKLVPINGVYEWNLERMQSLLEDKIKQDTLGMATYNETWVEVMD
jgi:hypothetical protein